MKRRTRRTRREREGGFALLLVFVMAAAVAIALYMEVPRVAFEAQRQKEQMLVERGQQYQIAIRRYMQRGLRAGVNQQVGPPWPTKIEDLENTNGRRFLRKRYLDPMTGKDEWRIIHINNGVLVDSINNKPKQGDQQEGMRAGSIAELAGLAETPTGGAGVNAAQSRRRASDGGNSIGGGGGANDPSLLADAGNPGAPMPASGPQPGASAGVWGQSSSFGSGTPTPGQPQYPGQIGPAANSNNPGGVQPYFPQPGANPGAGITPQQLIGNLLTQPRPGPVPGASGGFGGSWGNSSSGGGNSFGPPGNNGSGPPGSNGFPNTGNNGFPNTGNNGFPSTGSPSFGLGSSPSTFPQVSNNGSNNTIGGGMAGFASKLDADAIMVCGDHTNYAEWEFIFDPSKWRAPADPRKAVIGTPAGSNQNSSSGSLNSGSSPSRPTQSGGTGLGGTNQNPMGTGGAQSNLASTCGMEARPGIQ